MPASETCQPCCTSTAVNTNVPGDAGANCYTTTGENLTLVASPTTTNILVGSSDAFGVGQVVFITDGSDYGHFRITGIPDSTHLTLLWLDYLPDATVGSVIGSGGKVSPSGPQGSEFTTTELAALNATLLTGIAALTDNTTGTASDTLAAGVGIFELSIPHTFIGGTSAVESVTNLTLGFNFKILSWSFVTEVLLVGALGSRVANLEINSTDVGSPASTCTIPIANAAVGTVTAATTISGNNTGNTTDTISLEIAAGGTAFTAGSGTFVIRIQNMDTANALASLADKINDIRSALIT